MPIKVLGLDCSSSTIGWGLVNENPELLAHGHIKPLNSKYNIFIRLQNVYEKMQDLCWELNPTHIVIEDILLHMKGKSSANTITTLAIFNRTAGLSLYTHTGIIPELLPVGTIRKIIRDNYPNVNRSFKKEEIPDIIREYLSSKFSNIINKNNNISNETYDEADGIIAAWAYSLKLSKNNESI